jgi:hypothetical protein
MRRIPTRLHDRPCCLTPTKHRLFVPGVDTVLDRSDAAIARRHPPLLVAKLETHEQLTLGCRIHALQDCLGRSHFRSP